MLSRADTARGAARGNGMDLELSPHWFGDCVFSPNLISIKLPLTQTSVQWVLAPRDYYWTDILRTFSTEADDTCILGCRNSLLTLFITGRRLPLLRFVTGDSGTSYIERCLVEIVKPYSLEIRFNVFNGAK